jgi:MoaA/NifB/PqqE/SkfB family radical SAM enzyme
MRYLQIRGERKVIPGYPHHKDFVYRCYRFFEVTNVFDFLTIDGYSQVFRKLKFNRKYKCAVPRLLLIDPTSACNLRCRGCWAADYKRNSNLSYEKLDELFTEAEQMGVVQIIMSGGEPLLRKDDIIDLCGKHSKMTFGMFTNGTLIDEKFVGDLVRLGNLTVFLSIEGTREETDARRGEGTYDKVLAAMDLLKKHDIGFAFSACYHSGNYRTIAGDDFLNFMQEKGAWFGWLFNYLPIGSDADVSLCCTAEQRAHVLRSIEAYHKRNKFRIIDFANSGHKAIGCVAAGNDFAHINANGDLEPCAFCHYSDSNIHDMSLAEALRSQFFRKFREHKPFSANLLRPCPLIDVPEAIVALAGSPGIRSTHLGSPESAAQLAGKTRPLAEKWRPVAEKIHDELPPAEKRRFGILTSFLFWGNRYKNKY